MCRVLARYGLMDRGRSVITSAILGIFSARRLRVCVIECLSSPTHGGRLSAGKIACAYELFRRRPEDDALASVARGGHSELLVLVAASTRGLRSRSLGSSKGCDILMSTHVSNVPIWRFTNLKFLVHVSRIVRDTCAHATYYYYN